MGLQGHNLKNAVPEERDGKDATLGRQCSSPESLYNTASLARSWILCKWNHNISFLLAPFTQQWGSVWPQVFILISVGLYAIYWTDSRQIFGLFSVFMLLWILMVIILLFTWTRTSLGNIGEFLDLRYPCPQRCQVTPRSLPNDYLQLHMEVYFVSCLLFVLSNILIFNNLLRTWFSYPFPSLPMEFSRFFDFRHLNVFSPCQVCLLFFLSFALLPSWFLVILHVFWISLWLCYFL